MSYISKALYRKKPIPMLELHNELDEEIRSQDGADLKGGKRRSAWFSGLLPKNCSDVSFQD
jgi:hypothetical protein